MQNLKPLLTQENVKSSLVRPNKKGDARSVVT